MPSRQYGSSSCAVTTGVMPSVTRWLTVFGGQRAQHPHQRQVGRRPRLVEPFLADRPAAVMGQPRQVGVQDQGEEPGNRCGARSRPHRDRDQVQAVVDVAVARVGAGRSRRCVTDATSASSSAGHGASASARAICASMIEPPCLASSSASRGPWNTPRIASTVKPAVVEQLGQLGGVELAGVERVDRGVAAGGEGDPVGRRHQQHAPTAAAPAAHSATNCALIPQVLDDLEVDHDVDRRRRAAAAAARLPCRTSTRG